ncbi:TonB-dependent receptor [Methylobacterium sp. WL18]|uniref:TonB-dependent receptor n=1 Tax=Methylobacterium sp. WL18 TaxID=2603897 RepID=UPI00164EE108|nr:TonB-dependent receptor [Methylobacterium sp. WL18]
MVLDALTVTARRRPENPIAVPISVTVRKGSEADSSTSASNANLTRSVPNFYFTDAGGLFGNATNIRGVGAISPLSSDDTSVVFYHDEMPISVYSIAPNLFDTQRVEVLRGPQGTLFGRNTQAGAVNIVSNAPTFDRSFVATGEVGSNGYRLGQFVANGALIPDRLAGRLAVRWNTFGGDIPNIAAGGKDGGLDIGAARGSLLVTTEDQTEALLTFNYGKERSHSPRFLLSDTPRFPISATNPRTLVDGESRSVNLRIKHEFDGFILNTQTSYQHSGSINIFDPTDDLVFALMPMRGPGLPSWKVPGADVTRLSLGEDSFLQEMRASSLPDSWASWTAGVNYFRSESSAGRNSRALTPTFFAMNGVQDNRFLVDSYAAFGEMTVPLAERLKATLGLRATHEDKDAHFRFNGNGLPGVSRGFAQDASLDDDFMTGRVALSYEWTPDVMTYASVGRGYVTAGYPAYSVNSALSKPEAAFPASTSWTYEVGFKARQPDDLPSLSGSAFFNDVKNGHLILFEPSQALFTTVAVDYQSYGGELELAAKVTPDFDVFGGVGYTHAELVDIPAKSFTGAKSGNAVPNVPAITGNAGAEYRWSADSLGMPGRFAGRIVYQYVDTRAADARNSFNLKAYGIVNLKLTWQNDDVSVYVFANNVFDDRYQAWGQAFGPIRTVRVGQGRIFGVGTAFQF